MTGCKAAAGVSVTEISRDLQARREWVYQQKGCVLDYIGSLDDGKEIDFKMYRLACSSSFDRYDTLSFINIYKSSALKNTLLLYIIFQYFSKLL